MVQQIGLHVPDIMPLDFFLWGYVKDRIYVTTVRDLQDLRVQIVEAVGTSTITPDMFQQTWEEPDYGLDILRVTDSAHKEVY
jgi:hypothetical protein